MASMIRRPGMRLAIAVLVALGGCTSAVAEPGSDVRRLRRYQVDDAIYQCMVRDSRFYRTSVVNLSDFSLPRTATWGWRGCTDPLEAALAELESTCLVPGTANEGATASCAATPSWRYHAKERVLVNSSSASAVLAATVPEGTYEGSIVRILDDMSDAAGQASGSFVGSIMSSQVRRAAHPGEPAMEQRFSVRIGPGTTLERAICEVIGHSGILVAISGNVQPGIHDPSNRYVFWSVSGPFGFVPATPAP